MSEVPSAVDREQNAAGNPPPGRRVLRRGLRPAAVRARPDARPLRRPRLRRRRIDRAPSTPSSISGSPPDDSPSEFEAGLADFFPVDVGHAGQFRLLGEPGGRQRLDLAAAGRPARAAGRRDHHRGGRLPHHGQSDPPERRRARLRRRRAWAPTCPAWRPSPRPSGRRPKA